MAEISEVLPLMPFVTIRPTEVGIVERLGKFHRIAGPGFSFMIPVIDNVRIVNMTEQMADIAPQMVITKDKLNVIINAVVYYKVLDPKAALYNVNHHEAQTIMLATTSLRAVIGNLSLTETIEARSKINAELQDILAKETRTYGIDILRCELQKIEPPKNIQDAMNDVVRTENLKLAARNEADAAEIKADGIRLANIKAAEGKQRAMELEAQGQANAIRFIAEAEAAKIELINRSIRENFVGPAVEYKKLETALGALAQGTKVICGTSSSLVNVISDAAGVSGIVPISEDESNKAVVPVTEVKAATPSACNRAINRALRADSLVQ